MATVTPIPTSVTERLSRIWETPHTLYGQLATVDHKIIGKRYLVTSMIFLLVGGAEAVVMRMQLVRSNVHLLSPETYNQLFTMHGTTLILWYASPILSGFSNYIWPLMLGSRDMAYPRVNALSYWTFLLSGVFLYTGYIAGMGPDRGWFAYAPLTLAEYSPRLNMDFYALGLLFLTVSTTVGAINFIGTLMKMRAPGMSLNRLPIFVYGTLTASVSVIFSLPSLSVALVFLYLQRRFGFHFYDATNGGSPMLWQHLFWIWGHPWVYIIVLPAMGMISEIIPTFARRPLVGYGWVALATVVTGILGFGVWVHHMFATGLPQMSMAFFSVASLTIVFPSAVAVFSWIGTIWHGRPVWKTPMLFAAGFIILFVIGGVSGVVTAAIPYDWQVTDSYFVVAHLHYVLVGINVFPVMAAFYYWLPKMTGRMMNETLGKWNFWVMFIGFNLGFFPMHIAGLLGMPRRIYTYPAGLGWDTINLITSIGAWIFAIGVLLFIVNFIWSVQFGEPAGDNPWDAGTLEWSTSSPPPEYNFAVIPTIRSRLPLWEGRVMEGQTNPDARSAIWQGPALADGREAVGVSPLDADPMAVLRMPKDSLAPLLLALSLTGVFYGLVTGIYLMALLFGICVLLCLIGWLWPASPSPEESDV